MLKRIPLSESSTDGIAEWLPELSVQELQERVVRSFKQLPFYDSLAIMLLSIVLVISGLGLTLLGIVPGVEEIGRLLVYLIISIFYIAFWFGVAILFSIYFRGIATSALASVALWIFLSFFISLSADVLADSLSPLDRSQGIGQAALIKNTPIKEEVSLFSPMVLYSKASATLVDPMVNTTRSLVFMGPMEKLSSSRFQNPLPLVQSMIVVYPYIVVLVVLTLIRFAISCLVFMVQEIRT